MFQDSLETLVEVELAGLVVELGLELVARGLGALGEVRDGGREEAAEAEADWV